MCGARTSPAICPSNPAPFQAKRSMEKETGPATGIRGFARWAITPPQSYAVYLICLFLIAGLSFYAGTLKPKKAVGMGPPPMSAPRY
jgi:hypothetical protein